MTAITAFLAAIGTAFVGFQRLQVSLGLSSPQCAALLAALLLLLFFSYTLPTMLERRKRLKLGLITGATRPGYFQLCPREDEESFRRADGKHEEVLKWLKRPSSSLLYLTGSSGTGKSSLLAAWVLPRLGREGVRIIRLRGYQDPAQALEDELKRPGAVWKKSPPESTDLSSLFDQAVERLRPARMLLVFDQFEEFLILREEKQRRRFVEFLATQARASESTSTILLVFRAEYDGFIQELGLPPPVYGQNLHKVSAFTQRAAQDFLAVSGLKIQEQLLADVLREAAEVEETRGMIRPVTLNLCGLVLARFSTGLPHSFRPGHLIRGFVHETIFDKELGKASPTLLRKLISPEATKKPRTIYELSQGTTLTPRQVQGVMFKLSAPERGIVRALDLDYQVWEFSHDFLVPIIDSMLANWRLSLWKRIRPWLPVGYLAIFLLLLSAGRFRPDPISELGQLHWQIRPLDDKSPDDEALINEGIKYALTFESIPPPGSIRAMNHLRGKLWVRLHDIPSFDEDHFSEWKNLKGLTALDLSSNTLHDVSGFKNLPPSITTLNLENDRLTDDAVKTLPRSLTTLDLSGNEITDAGLKNLPPSLTTLLIASDDKITDLGLRNLPPSLTNLSLRDNYQVTDAGLKSLPPSLTTLNLRNNYRITDAGLKNLPATLTILILTGDQITDDGLKNLPRSLTVLHIRDDDKITGAGLRNLPPSLKLLNIGSDYKITDAGLKNLPQSLTALLLDEDRDLTDDGLRNLPSSLEALNLNGDYKVTDNGLKNLPRSLKTLHIAGDNKITNDGLEKLKSLNPSVKVDR